MSSRMLKFHCTNENTSKLKNLPVDWVGGDGELNGGGGEKGGAPGQGFVVAGPQRFGLLAKL